MAECPVCQAHIEINSQHNGTLFTCPECSAVFFVDWSGKPEVSETVEATDGMGAEQAPPEGFLEPLMEPSMEPPIEPDLSSEPMDFEPLPYDAEEIPMPEPMTPLKPEASPLEDIAEFGNADLDKAAFNYTITISGIDSGILRGRVQEALTDSKFGWNSSQMMDQIKGGVLTIKSVNAVKASILIQRVKYLPVKISWRQDVLSSTV